MKETSRLHLRVIAPGRFVLDEEVDEVLLPGLDGQIGILPGHRPLILGLGRGELFYRRDEKQNHLSLLSGYATISPREVIVFTEGTEEKKPAAAED
jgi:F-type H+-transporting ATPase subunit epsilon